MCSVEANTFVKTIFGLRNKIAIVIVFVCAKCQVILQFWLLIINILAQVNFLMAKQSMRKFVCEYSHTTNDIMPHRCLPGDHRFWKSEIGRAQNNVVGWEHKMTKFSCFWGKSILRWNACKFQWDLSFTTAPVSPVKAISKHACAVSTEQTICFLSYAIEIPLKLTYIWPQQNKAWENSPRIEYLHGEL